MDASTSACPRGVNFVVDDQSTDRISTYVEIQIQTTRHSIDAKAASGDEWLDRLAQRCRLEFVCRCQLMDGLSPWARKCVLADGIEGRLGGISA